MPSKAKVTSSVQELPWVLQDRDDEIIAWTNRHGVVNVQLIAKQFFERQGSPGTGKWATYKRVKKLVDMGYLSRQTVRIAQADAIRVTVRGARVASFGLQPAPEIPHDIQHVFAVVDLTIDLERKHPEAELLTERQWRQRLHHQVKAGTRPPNYGRIPDAVLLFPDGKEIAVELERHSKRSRELEDSIEAYNLERFYRTWWFFRSEAVAKRMQVILIRAGADRVHEVFVRGD